MKFPRSRYARRVLVPVMAVSLLSACHTWKVQELTPSQVVAEKQPGRIRLTTLDGDKIQIGDPTVSNGEIVGHPVRRNAGGYYRAVRSETLRLATDSVARIEVREINGPVTAIAVLFGLVVVGVVAFAVAMSNWDGPMGGCCG
jgi:hypothetical protein